MTTNKPDKFKKPAIILMGIVGGLIFISVLKEMIYPTQKPIGVDKIVSLDSIGAKTKETAEKYLGPADSSTTIYEEGLGCDEGCIKAYYKNRQVEVIYINGIADWIIVTPKQKVLISSLYSPLQLIGGTKEDLEKVTFSNDMVMRFNWRLNNKAPEIQLFRNGDTLLYYHIKLVTN